MTAIFTRSITIRRLNLPRLFSPLHPSILVGILLSIILCQPLHAGITDCNNNGIEDATDIANGTSTDCNADGVPDDCASGVAFRPYEIYDGNFFLIIDGCMLDIDRDGDLDFAALLGNSIAIVESATGRGPTEFFSNAYVDNWSSSFNEIQSGDIDNDGDDDLITNTSQGLSWLENADDYGGTWIAHPISPFTYTDLTCVDFDGDGDNDIVANGVFSQTGVRFLENLDGNGTFAPDQLLATTNNLRDFVFADIDGDGFDDIAVTANQFQSLGWFRFNQQTQNYEPIEYIQTPFSNLGRIAAADFDDDNDIDLLVAHNEFGIYGWLRNNGTGEFELGQQFSSPALRPINIQAVDLNSDQYSDILVGSNSSAALGWHINTNGLGSFTNVPELQFVDGHRAAYMSNADVDGDGADDFITVGSIGRGPYVFFATDHDCDDNGMNDACEIADGLAADCDANGIPDVCDSVLADCNGNQTPDWCEFDCDFNGLIEFCEPLIEFTALPIAENLELPYGLDLGDINHDGRQDIVMTELDGGAVSWYPLEPSGQFGPKHVIENNVFEPLHVLLIDVDEDGWLDVVFNTYTDGDIYWCHNVPGDDTFEPKVLFSDTESEVIRLEAFDIDGDGDRDVVGTSLQGSIFWHENLVGTGVFGPIRYISNNFPGARPFDFADMDADGDLDIIASSFTDSRIAWFPNLDGVGNFGAPITIEDQLNGAVVTVALDMDEDGDNDIYVSADSNANDGVAPDQFWLKNLDGAGTSWTRRTLYDGDTNVFATTVTDVDQDGMLDIVRGNFSGFSWYSRFNRPGGTWGHVRGLDADLIAPITIKPTDLDGDGDLDIVLTSQFQNTLYAFYQSPDDCDGDGFPDRCQADTDNDGLIDACEPQPGDVNCDGVVDIADVPAFALALINPAIYAVQFSDCTMDAADVNADQLLNAGDVEGMLTLLISP